MIIYKWALISLWHSLEGSRTAFIDEVVILHKGVGININTMICKRQTQIPVSVLWSYREFKRDEVSAPRLLFMHMHSIGEIKDHIQVNGLETLELSIIKHTALLTDGNHRIVAASQLGYARVPVEIVVYFASAADTFYEHTLNRFKPIDKSLEQILRSVFFYKAM